MKEEWSALLKAALVRAARTVAQTAAATIGTSAVMSEAKKFSPSPRPMISGLSLRAAKISPGRSRNMTTRA